MGARRLRRFIARNLNSNRFLESIRTEKLTIREHEILALLAQGFLYKEIGDKLEISIRTVRSHLRHIYEKLHVQSRTEATVKFLKRD